MTNNYRWVAWNLTPDGWIRSYAAESRAEVTRSRPDDALLTVLSTYRIDEPRPRPLVSVLYRSPDAKAVAAAIAKFGGKPPD